MTEPLDKGYDPARVEPKWSAFWEEHHVFRADEHSTRPPYTLVLPPPNVTGVLHMGHALTTAIQDMLIRHKRMGGFNVLWLPGTDHAGIATQMVVERDLMVKEGKTRHEIGRDAFIERVWEWKRLRGGRINEQERVLGASLDWSRERFTMDEGCSRAVREAFVRLHEEGLVYRAQRLINWCPRCRTALSDLEVDHQEGVKGEMWSFAYPLADGSGEIVVSTTRPETMLGDTAVAVHPDDERYKTLIGRSLRHPILGYEFPIIGDAILVDPAFGTGAVKVTPAHDPNDFETGQRHALRFINLLNPDGTMNENAGPFAGQDRAEARRNVKQALEDRGLFRGREDHLMSIGACQRCETIVEPYLSPQWFVRIQPLADAAMEAVRKGETVFVPREWEKTFFEWMSHIRDWCVSRQLWWGHRIPVWYCDDCGERTVARTDPDRCPKCGSARLRQDDDVLDTWFSSGLWPFSTLGWPDRTKDLEVYYPNGIMETGFDIIFFWVARMMMMGLHFMGKPPFPVVFLHAMVRDHEGRKMSKSLGNVIDPLDVISGISLDDLLAKRESDARMLGLAPRQIEPIAKATRKLFPQGIPPSGADALRFALLSMAGQGRDIKLDVKRIEGFRFFANKIWNASRFALMHLDGFDPARAAPDADLSLADRWILHRLRETVGTVEGAIAAFQVDQAAMAIYHFFWNELCDWYIELIKPALYAKEEGAASRDAARGTLARVLETAMRLLHPFMPFITEEIWQKLPKPGAPLSIALAPYPLPGDFESAAAYAADAARMQRLMEIIGLLRNIRGECGLEPARRIPAVIETADPGLLGVIEEQRAPLIELARLSELTVVDRYPKTGPCAKGVVSGAEIFVPLAGLLDVAEEEKRVRGQLQKIEKELSALVARLSDEGFVARAPAEIVERETARRAELTERRDKLGRHLEEISG